MAVKRVLTFEMVIRGLAMKYEGKTYDEIARALGCSRSTVARWLPRLEALMKQNLPMLKVAQGKVKVESTVGDLASDHRAILERLEKIEEKLSGLEKAIRELRRCIS